MNRKHIHPLSALVAAIALASAAPVFAGEALPEELPSMRTPITNQVPDGVTSRAEVKAELMAARSAGTLPMAGEAGDTERVLAARQVANDEQAREIVARYEAEAAAQVAMADAEARRVEIENEAQIALLADDGEVAYSYDVAPLADATVTAEAPVSADNAYGDAVEELLASSADIDASDVMNDRPADSQVASR